MEEKDFKKLSDELGKDIALKVTAQLDEIKNEVVSKDDLATAVKDLEKVYGKDSEVMKTLQEQLDKIATDVKKGAAINETRKNNQQLTKDVLTSDKFKEWNKKKTGAPFTFELKTVGDMTESGNLTGEIPLAQQEPGVSKTPDRPVFMQSIIPVGTTTSNSIAWIERTAREGTVAAVAEGGVYQQLDMDYRRYETPVEKTAAYIKVSEEMWDDVDFIRSEINSELFNQIDRSLDNDLLKGSGVSPILGGLDEYVTAYSLPSGFSTTDPITPDAIRACKLQVTNANYIPNICVMNPTDYENMMSEKDNEGRFQQIQGGALSISGLRIVTNTNVTQDYIYVGDFNKAKIYTKGGIVINIYDQNENDAIYGYRTITGVVRAAFRVSGQDTTAFVKGQLSVIIAGL